MRALVVARKELRETSREPMLLALVVLAPLAFVAITAFGYGGPLLSTHRLLVMGADAGSEPLLTEIAGQRYADGRPVFEVERMADREAAEAELESWKASALLIIAPGDDRVTIRGDALNLRLYRASTILESVVRRQADRRDGRPEVVRIEEQPLMGVGPRTEFDVYAPGMIVFALLMIVPQTAMLLSRELRWNTLHRLRITRLRAWELLAGVTIAQMAVAVLQVVVVIAAAEWLGFNNRGSTWHAVLVGLAISFSAVGVGLVVACIVENDSQAINVGCAVTMFLVFLSGSFYQLPPVTVLSLAGHEIDLFDVFPVTHGFLALKNVLSYGASLSDVAFRLAMTVGLSVGYFVLGVAVFHRLQMREQSLVVRGRPRAVR